MSDGALTINPKEMPGKFPTTVQTMAELSYTVLALVIFAGTRPLRPGHATQLGLDSRGSEIEALLFLVPTAICILAAALHFRPKRADARIVLFFVFLTYCGLSLLWSEAMFLGTKRFVQYLLVSVSLISVAYVIGAERLISITYRVLIVLLLVNFLAVLLFESAAHRAGGSLAGAWKGVQIHKNYAGAVAAVTCLIAFCYIFSGRWKHIIVFGLSAVFLLGTTSKASLFFTIGIIGLLILSKILCISMGKTAAQYLLVFLILMISVVVFVEMDRLAIILENPFALTGRIEVWNALGRYVEAYPLTGSGFGSFWRIGQESPILHLTDGWSTGTGQGHNGYLDIAATLGVPGLLLAMIALVAVPVVVLMQKFEANSLQYNIFFCLILFGLTHNTLESSFLSGNHPIFLGLILGVVGIYSHKSTGRALEG